MNKAAYNEQLKLFANLVNALAAAFISVGFIGPMFAFFYGLVAVSVAPLAVATGILICVALSTGLHLVGCAILGGIQE
jgi:hypothetical protein